MQWHSIRQKYTVITQKRNPAASWKDQSDEQHGDCVQPCASGWLLASGQDDPEWTLEKEMAAKRGVAYEAPEARARVDDEDHQQQEATAISEGDRCEVTPGGKRGTVRSLYHPPPHPPSFILPISTNRYWHAEEHAFVQPVAHCQPADATASGSTQAAMLCWVWEWWCSHLPPYDGSPTAQAMLSTMHDTNLCTRHPTLDSGPAGFKAGTWAGVRGCHRGSG